MPTTNNDNKSMNVILTDLQVSMTSMMHTVESGIDDELASIRGQVEQIQSLLKDAIASLYSSFEQLDTHTSEQMQLMEKFIFDTTGESKDVLDGQNIFQRTHDASHVLKDLVAREIESSEEVLAALMTMEKLKHQIVDMDDEIRCSGEVINAMAALEHIEGDDSAELRALIEKEQTFQKKRDVTIKVIKSNFSKVHRHIDISAHRDIKDVYAARESVEQLLQHIYGVDEMISGCRSKVTDVNGAIRKDLGNLVRSLQFEDIVGQSLGHTTLHLERMDGFVKRICQGVSAMQEMDAGDIPSYTGQLRQLQNDVMAYRDALRLEELNPVSQQNMDEGDVDLF